MIYVLVNNTIVNSKNLVIENELTHAPDMASFSMEDPSVVPIPGMSVLIYRDTITNILFGGSILSVNKRRLAPSSVPANRLYSYDIVCTDYQRMLDRYLVKCVYEDITCGEIIQDIVANYTDLSIGYTTNNVATGPTIKEVSFNYIRPSEAITQLCTMTKYDWYVDYNKDIHFFAYETRPAPFTINDTVLATKVDNFQLTPDFTQVRNRVYVRGGYYLSDTFREFFAPDGRTRIWPLAHKPHAVSSILLTHYYGGQDSYTSAVDYINADDGTFDFFWNYEEKYFRCANDFPTPAEGDLIDIDYQYEIPILVCADNYASQIAIAAVEGGTGVYEHIIVDDSIMSKEMAHDRARVEVNTFGDALVTGSFTTYEHGFKSGQYITVACSGYESYVGNYQIQRVLIRLLAPDVIQYQVTFASTLYELKDLLLNMLKNNKKSLVYREDEMVDNLNLLNGEVTIEEVTQILLNLDTRIKWGSKKWGSSTKWGESL